MQDEAKRSYFDYVAAAPTLEIQAAITKANQLLNERYDKIVVSVSGGADSDVMLDIVLRVISDREKLRFVFFDTGMEFQATKDHLDGLERKYGIQIDREKAVVPVPFGVRKYGQPFLSKNISDYIERLQRHGFKWEDRPFDELYAEYPKCKAALRWWCNDWGEKSRFNISRTTFLKEFMVENPPTFKISHKCCDGAKKNTAKRFQKNCDADLSVQGVRQAEGGVRSTAYKSCWSDNSGALSYYRPLFWFLKEDKDAYCETFGVCHSRCYTEYGLPRTGCACCPFGSGFEKELAAAEKYEPKLYKAALKVFGDSYEYTRAYRQYKERRDADGRKQNQG